MLARKLRPIIVMLAMSSGKCDHTPSLALGQTAVPMNSGTAAHKQPLRVALFPWLPDPAGDNFKSLASALKTRFERENPDTEVTIILDKGEDLYNRAKVAWLLDPPRAADRYDIVEVDEIMLSEVVATKRVAPWALPPQPEWHPAGKLAGTIDNKLYAVPHWLCAHFLFARDPGVAAASSADELVGQLRRIATPIPNLAGDFLGSWNLPALYLDAWVDTYGSKDLAQQVALNQLDETTVVPALKAVANQCIRDDKSNPCTSGKFNKDPDLAAIEFAEGGADSFLGYSERLHVILSRWKGPGTPQINLAPLGTGNSPVVFVDGLVLNEKCAEDPECARRAQQFALYLTRADIMEFVLLSHDAVIAGKGAQKPRYLIPATAAAYTKAVVADPYFPLLKKLVQAAVPFPNGKLYDIRSQLRDQLVRDLR